MPPLVGPAIPHGVLAALLSSGGTGDVTSAQLAAAVALLQDKATAATDAELAAHAVDSTLHSSGQRTGYAVNNLGTAQTITTTSTTVPNTTVSLPQISRPQVLRGRVAVKCTTAMTATAGTVTTITATLFDDLGNGLEAGTFTVDASTTNAWFTVFVEYDIEADAAARTYHLEVSRSGSTSGTFQALNNAVAGFRSALRAQAC